MARIREWTRGNRPTRWRRLAAEAAIATALLAAMPSISRAENAVCVGESCGGTYAAIATTGQASSSSGVAVSGTGGASGGSASISGTGYSYGGVVAASGTYRADGSSNNLSGEAFLINTGLLEVAQTAESALVPLTDTIDPMDTANKLQTAAEMAPWVAQNMALGLLPNAPSSSSTTAAQCPDGTCRPPMDMHINQGMIAQERWYYCAPASAAMFLSSAGVGPPSQNTLAQRLGTTHPEQATNERQAGTPFGNIPAAVNNIRQNGDRMVLGQANSADNLMTHITTDIYNYRHGTILSTQPSRLRSWSGRGAANGHAVVAYGYNHRNRGTVLFMDPYDYTRFNWSQQSWGGPNPGGAHEEPLPENVWPAVQSRGGNHVW